MTYIIYEITNLIDGKIYVGCHKTNNLDDGYMGSGKYLKHAIKKHGVENFEKDILGEFDTEEEMLYVEGVLVDEEFVSRKDTYNLKVGGMGGFGHIKDIDYIERSKNGVKRWKELYENDPDFRERMKANQERNSANRTSNMKRVSLEKYGNETYIFGNSFRGKKHTDETKRKIGDINSKHQMGTGNSMYGTMWITNEVESTRIRKDEEIPEGWRKGRKMKGCTNGKD